MDENQATQNSESEKDLNSKDSSGIRNNEPSSVRDGEESGHIPPPVTSEEKTNGLYNDKSAVGGSREAISKRPSLMDENDITELARQNRELNRSLKQRLSISQPGTGLPGQPVKLLRRKPITGRRKDIIEKWKDEKKPDHLPIIQTQEALKSLAQLVDFDLVTSDLSGLDQMSDAFFRCLSTNPNIEFPHLTKLKLNGCVKLTDCGIRWMAKKFPELEKVSLNGCHRLTEDSVAYLLESCPKLFHIHMLATSVTVIPHIIGNRICLLKVDGCPLVSPTVYQLTEHGWMIYKDEHKDEMGALHGQKVVFLTRISMPMSISCLLENQQIQKLSQPAHVTKLGNLTVFEVNTDQVSPDIFCTRGSVVVIPYIPATEEDFNDQVTSLVQQILCLLSKEPRCAVSLLQLSSSAMAKAEAENKLGVMKAAVMERLQKKLDEIRQEEESISGEPWLVAGLHVRGQHYLAKIAAAAELYEEALKHLSWHSITYNDKDSVMGYKNIIESVCKKAASECTPWYEVLTKEFTDAVETELPGTPVTTLDDVCDTSFGLNMLEKISKPALAKAMRILDLKGYCVFFSDMEEQPAVWDLPWLMEVLHASLQTPNQRCGPLLRCVPDSTPAWTEQQLVSALQQSIQLSTQQAHLFLKLFHQQGNMVKVLCTERSELSDPCYMYIPWAHLPWDPHIPKSMFWAEEVVASTFQAHRCYWFLQDKPSSFMSQLFRELGKVFQFTVLWQSGAIIHQGAITIMLQLEMTRDTPVIFVGVRTPTSRAIDSLFHKSIKQGSVQDLESVHTTGKKAMWATLKLVTSIVDHFLDMCNICAKVTIPCPKCIVNQKTTVILDNPKINHIPLYKAVAATETVLYCSGSSDKGGHRLTKVELLGTGPQHLCHVPDTHHLSTIFPACDDLWLQNKSHPATRCSLCRCCATGQDRCPHNFINGHRRTCGCDGRWRVHPVTGMCCKCIMYLENLEMSLEPGLSTAEPFIVNRGSGEADDTVTVSGNIIKSKTRETISISSKWALSCTGFCDFSVVPLKDNAVVLSFCGEDQTVTLDLSIGQLTIKNAIDPGSPPDTDIVNELAFEEGHRLEVKVTSAEKNCTECELQLYKDGDLVEVFTMKGTPIDLHLCLKKPTTIMINTQSVPSGRFCTQSPSPHQLEPGMLLELITNEGQQVAEVVMVKENTDGQLSVVPLSLMSYYTDTGSHALELDKIKMEDNPLHLLPWRYSLIIRPLGYGAIIKQPTKLNVYNSADPNEAIFMTTQDFTTFDFEGCVPAPSNCFTKEQLNDRQTWLEYVKGQDVLPVPAILSWWLYQLYDHITDFIFTQTELNMTGAISAVLPRCINNISVTHPECFISQLDSGSADAFLYPLCHTRSGGEILQQPYSSVRAKHHLCQLHLVKSAGHSLGQGQVDNMTLTWFLLACHASLLQDEQVEYPENCVLVSGLDSAQPEEIPQHLRKMLTVWLDVAVCLVDDVLRLPDCLNTKNAQMKNLVVEQRKNMGAQLDSRDFQIVRPAFCQQEDDILYVCPAHAIMQQNNKDLTCIPKDLFNPYSKFLRVIELQSNEIRTLPDEFFLPFPNLQELDMKDNQLEELPPQISQCKLMNCLQLSHNSMTQLPEALDQLKSLKELHLSGNKFISVPEVLTKVTSLKILDISSMQLIHIPGSIGQLVHLESLDISNNCLEDLPPSIGKLNKLRHLNMSGIPWLDSGDSYTITRFKLQEHLRKHNLVEWFNQHPKEKKAMLGLFNEDGLLPQLELGKLNAMFFYLFPRLGMRDSLNKDCDGDKTRPSGLPSVIFDLPQLESLNLSYQVIHHIPEDVKKLCHLQILKLSHNPKLVSLSADIGSLPLQKLHLDECVSLQTPPKEIQRKGLEANLAFLRRLQSGSVPCRRTKLMFVGLGGAGKTSLLRAMKSETKTSNIPAGEDITDGIDITDWSLTIQGSTVKYSMWDFAGQTVYYNTHQFFLSKRAVYLLLWNIRLGYEHAGLDFWLSSITVHAPKTPIFVVGTHVDQVPKFELPLNMLKKKYSQIVGFHFVSSHTGQGLQELEQHIHQVSLQQSYIGEQVPAAWLIFEKTVTSKRHESPVVEYKDVEQAAINSGIFDEREVREAVQFLHHLGSLQHFRHPGLRDQVVINPQWIVDAMACVVSVKDSTIQGGKLYHKDLAKIWAKYPTSLQKWLLHLTEEFDLTFPLEGQNLNLVPCLLPEREPQFDWPDADRENGIKEMKMIYKFTYLPAGLFNRGQVRLYQFSDSSVMWKKGSLLHKNKHQGLVTQTSDSELHVKVQGPQPENILFLVQEVFEGLISESFQGVSYDFLFQCPDCTEQGSKDAHMFLGSTVKRATELKAPFLQCTKHFHVVSLSDMHVTMPPSSNKDYDIHLVSGMQGLSDLRKAMTSDVFISYCEEDMKLEEEKKMLVGPSLIYKDLTKAGIKCSYGNKGQGHNGGKGHIQQTIVAMKDAKAFLAVVSDQYVKNTPCSNLFRFATNTLKKSLILVVIGSGSEWKKSELGMLVTDEVFVNMQNPERYKIKLQELIATVQEKISAGKKDKVYPPCFISYCWQNSKQAVAKGTRTIEGAVGFGDPREIKEYLETEGIPCWIDKEQVGKKGLFEDIAEGLTHARVFVACMSDQYAASDNCLMEFRFATSTLKLPCIIAVVGTGNAWRATEVGMRSMTFPEVSFQEGNTSSFKRILKLVKASLPAVIQEKQPIKRKADGISTNQHQQNVSFQELYELLQRKFLRQLTMYASVPDNPFPRLIVVDFSEPVIVKQTESGESSARTFWRRLSQTIIRQDVSNRSSSRTFCFKVLCEYEEGWHNYADPIPCPDGFNESMLTHFSPYLARITNMLKHSNTLDLNCTTGLAGMYFMHWLQELPQAMTPDFGGIYRELQDLVGKADLTGMKGNLTRCHLPSGKTLWLCPDHQKMPGVTIVTDDVIMPATHAASDNAEDSAFLSAINDPSHQKRALSYIKQWQKPEWSTEAPKATAEAKDERQRTAGGMTSESERSRLQRRSSQLIAVGKISEQNKKPTSQACVLV